MSSTVRNSPLILQRPTTLGRINSNNRLAEHSLALRFGSEGFDSEGDSLTLSGPALESLRALRERQTLGFRDEFQRVINAAKAHLTEYLKTHAPARTAVVMDLDDTLFDNTGMALHGVLSPEKNAKEVYTDWIHRAESPAIPEALAFVHWLKTRGVSVFFVTFRKEAFRAATVANLQRLGLQPGDYAGLYLNGDRSKTAEQYKTGVDDELRRQGYDIALKLGDRDADIAGVPPERGFKLPNPL